MLRLVAALVISTFAAWPSPAQDDASIRPVPRRIAPEHSGVPGPFRCGTQRDTDCAAAEAPLGACERSLRRPAWLRCLRESADFTAQRLEAVVADIKGAMDARPDTGGAQKRHWARSLR